MELETAKKLIERYSSMHHMHVGKMMVANRYYEGKNDILFRPIHKDDCDERSNPLRQADNRIPFNFHGLLVNQKAAYLFTAPPLFDVGDDALNEQVADVLGDAYAKRCKMLCVDASNTGTGWVHYWYDEQKGFSWAVIPSVEIYPIYNQRFEGELQAVMRAYKQVDDNGEIWDIFELWNDTECQAFRRKGDVYRSFDCFTVETMGLFKPTNVYRHGMGSVPFIEFPNNNLRSSDLDAIKALVDAYDKTLSGFVNDLEDVQEVIFVLTNYGNTDLKEFLHDLKYYKAIQTEYNGSDDKSGISTLTIDIPVEARDKLLELLRSSIFQLGQGVDPQQQGFDSTSGEAMKFLYSLLELKAGLMETEFRPRFGELVRAICRRYGKEPKQITQTWTRTAIRNDAELAAMCQQSVGIISTKTILKNHPFVENAEKEEKELAAEKEKQAKEMDNYPQGVHGKNKGNVNA